MPDAKPGKIYFYVVCQNPDCRKEIILHEAPPGQRIDEAYRTRGVTVACPHCQTEHTYPAPQVGIAKVEDSGE